MSGGAARIGFLSRAKRPDYLRRLARLRWWRRFPSSLPVDLEPQARARDEFAAAESWVVIRDETSLPVPAGELSAANGRVIVGAGRAASAPPIVHTLRELEEACRASRPIEAPDRARTFPAIAFRPSDFPPGDEETVSSYVDRLLSRAPADGVTAELSAIVFDGPDPGSAERTEVTRNFPPVVRRLLDVGCGQGEASAALSRARPDLTIVGIEVDPASAAAARLRIGRVLEGDAMAALAALADAGERFDGFLFADVLEHLEDPVAALSLAQRLALPRATLVASVPNVGHLSLVRDLIRGRFDPLPAGLADAGHLRWFTRSFLQEALEEAGWRVERIEALPGAPAPDADAFLRSLNGWAGADPTSLTTYQWVAVAGAGTAEDVGP